MNKKKKFFQCKICNKKYLKNNLIFNLCNEDKICLNCYKKQFPSIPIDSKPFNSSKILKKHD